MLLKGLGLGKAQIFEFRCSVTTLRGRFLSPFLVIPSGMRLLLCDQTRQIVEGRQLTQDDRCTDREGHEIHEEVNWFNGGGCGKHVQ